MRRRTNPLSAHENNYTVGYAGAEVLAGGSQIIFTRGILVLARPY
jgi:hypothetical protein